MTRALAYDVTRLFIGPLRAFPRGIDRVELGYGNYVFERWPGPRFGVLPTPWGVRVYDGERVLRGLRAIEAMWREADGERPDPLIDALATWLAGDPGPFDGGAGAADAKRARPVRGFYELIRATSFSFGTSAVRGLPASALYLNIGQIGVAWPPLTRWLDARPDVASVMMLHDVIPLDRPDLVKPSYPRAHANMIATVARRADGLIVNSAAAGDTIRRRLGGACPELRVTAVHLPVSRAFHRSAADVAPDGSPYFVVYGAIETRKNHRLLFRVWKDLLASHGEAAPKLVVVGSRGWGGRRIVDDLKCDAALSAHVAIVEGLPTNDLRRLLLGASACLAPSLVEGYGLPVAEALTLGVPVIASAIPSHVEVGQGCALLLDPEAVDAWSAAISAYAFDEHRRRAARDDAKAFAGTTWDDYARVIGSFLHSF